jgi:hypothetical protein
MKIGLLPASGKATRLNGIPKFLLPLEGHNTIINWHVKMMLQVCDEVQICTRANWISFLMDMGFPSNVKFNVIEPSTLSHALSEMMLENNKYLFGMPDTWIANTSENMYEELSKSEADVTLGAFKCSDFLIGQVGQLNIDDDLNIIDLREKDSSCTYPHMWGSMAFNNIKLNPSLLYPSMQIMDWIAEGKSVKAVKLQGDYIDAGSFEGLKRLYT